LLSVTPRSEDREAVVELRGLLDRAQFDGDTIRKMLGSEDEILSRSRDIPVHLRRLRDRGVLGTLVELFVLNVMAPVDRARAALAPLGLEASIAMGIVRLEDDVVRPLVRLVPHDHLIIASDLRLMAGQEAPNDHVPGVHRPTVTLARLTVRTPVKHGLDLGTGNGVEAILMRAHVEHVVGSDVNPRAIEFARFNGILNHTPDIDWRVGSWFAAMKDEKFDVIACNPPYVISPATQFVYRDSGMEGDSVSEQVVREIGAHLAEGGFGTITVSWAADPSDEDALPVRRWLEGIGCDAWILHYRTEDPLTTAKNWLEQEAVDAASFGRSLDEWIAYYERLGIKAIAYGAVVLHKRTAGRHWARVDPLPGGRLDVASDHIRRVFAAGDHLDALDTDASLLDVRFRVPPALRVSRVTTLDGEAGTVRVLLEEGVGFQAEVDEHIVNVLRSLHRGTLREALAAAATAGGLAARDRERFVTAGATLARRLYAMGLIDRVTDEAAVTTR
jgi:methylase of polypeptide subunit release factors